MVEMGDVVGDVAMLMMVVAIMLETMTRESPDVKMSISKGQHNCGGIWARTAEIL